MKRLLLVLALLAVAVPAFGQNPPQVRRGVPLYFDHDEQSITVTEKYGLCEDEVTDAKCKDIAGPVRLAGTLTFQFALPTWVQNGFHIYCVRAFGEGEWSDCSNGLTLHITGKPLPPTNHRNTPPPAPTGTSTTTSTTTSAPVAATVKITPGGSVRLTPKE